ncbi:helix-turn-helix transcriptional regulator [Streptomyces cocklensis]|jgi:DNA-binding HxlR family transcriptional regulator|uniref:Transcriptional regulator, HxlR family n=1 Tax=Actinacidiphila cocklensis TaxID=887465 RepID=A0A9W4GN14_9ACTN|nr:helix-turn-helix domain-containing protein [Actinacidiphila cocklensis]MDD1058694.1 helix-turn-helix transcriptional regulator [Actinacidiphila cocklensis]WSX75102.1 helix-turn-helix transcriptional regulator [Streptomyces sp. NBC_00899]CAG6390883.1 Transcriptional regulator, HxlR family [Actinacidiphila cocklensis]
MNGEVEVVEPHPEEACPIGPVVEIVFSRWTTPILWTLHACGRQRFGELERQIMSVTPKVLTDTLRKLERDGLVVRTTHPGVPARVEYEISELGQSLAGVFEVLANWSGDNLEKVRQARLHYEEREPARLRR